MMNLRQSLAVLYCLCTLALSKPINEKSKDLDEDLATADVQVPVKETEPEQAINFAEILKANDAAHVELFEGDIVLPVTRNAMMDKNHRWPLTVPYEIDPIYDYQAKGRIVSALQELSVRSCLTFVEHTIEEDYLSYEIVAGCQSHLGRIGGKQYISIGGGCDTHSIIIHETFHALGFMHEQSRTDRDDYVTIAWENIMEGKEGNFKKQENGTVDLLGMPYDYDSIMHYIDTAFSKNGDKTILALFEGGENMGRLDYLSPTDVAELNKYYECDETRDSNGYTEWTEWSSCDVDCIRHRRRFCDGSQCLDWGAIEEDTTGCDVECIVGLDPDCGQMTLTDSSGSIQSPLYPRMYKNDVTCQHTIEAPEGGIIHLSFYKFELENYYDNVYVYDGPDDQSQKIGVYTGNKLPEDITSTDNSLTIVFQADYAIVEAGFLANYYTSYAIDHTCEFETGTDLCGWTEDPTGETLLTLRSGPTPSSGTGPDFDHTYGDANGHYMYLESSRGVTGDAARLLSPVFPQPTSSVCFGMWYNMYGEDIGTLNVFLVRDGVTDPSPMITYTGDLGNNEWHQSFSSIFVPGSFQVKIEAIKGDGYVGDIAVDDVMLKSGPCVVS